MKLEPEGMENRITSGSEVGEQPAIDDEVVIFAVEPYQFTEQQGGEQSSATEANMNMKKTRPWSIVRLPFLSILWLGGMNCRPMIKA